jgi:glycosyltransferase involved in cell wall biosynthesis
MNSRVLIIVENLPVPFDRRVWQEATTLRAAGYAVSVICPQGRGYEAEYEEREGVHIYRHPLPPDISSTAGYLKEYAAALRGEFRLARRVWRERGFDIVHICNPPDLLFLVAGWFKLRRGVKIIFDHHDVVPEMFEAKFGRRGFFYWALRAAERLTFAAADLVISTNESHRRVARQRGRKPDERNIIVRSGPNLEKFQPGSPDPRFKRGKDYLVGYMGVMGEPEGLDLLLESIRYIVFDRGRRDIHFVLIGGGPLFEELQRLKTRLQLDEFVEFTGRIPDAEMIARLSTCDLCVNPDRKTPYNDMCTMNKILEYMALGRAIVQYDLVEGRFSAGEASLYAEGNNPRDFGDKILELLGNPERRARMGAAGRARMEQKLEWRHQAPQLLAAYARALGG